jgi:fatty-acyl-CoA synthase
LSGFAGNALVDAPIEIARCRLPKAILFGPVIERSQAGNADYRWAGAQAQRGR